MSDGQKNSYSKNLFSMNGFRIVFKSLLKGISPFLNYFNPKSFLRKEQYYLTHSWQDKGIHTFANGICPKVNVIARLKFELTYYESKVERFNPDTTMTPHFL